MPLSPALQVLSILAVLALAITLCLKFFLDYRAFKALGAGGTPSTITGFLQVQTLSFFALSNRFELPDTSPQHRQSGLQHNASFIRDKLPRRTGDRPVTKGIAPQRQLTQRITGEIYSRLHAGLTSLATTSPDKSITHSTSHIEGHSPVLFVGCGPPSRASKVCHLHAIDGSMHVVLGREDARVMLQRGWGEMHPLARGGWFERFVPVGFVLVYAPRGVGEVDVVLGIVGAAVRLRGEVIS